MVELTMLASPKQCSCEPALSAEARIWHLSAVVERVEPLPLAPGSW